MTLKELAEITSVGIKVKDAKDSRVLCFRYKGNSNASLAERKVLSVWSEIDVTNSGYDSFARAIVLVYVEHEEGKDK
jgi:hypothetical protein